MGTGGQRTSRILHRTGHRGAPHQHPGGGCHVGGERRWPLSRGAHGSQVWEQGLRVVGDAAQRTVQGETGLGPTLGTRLVSWEAQRGQRGGHALGLLPPYIWFQNIPSRLCSFGLLGFKKGLSSWFLILFNCLLFFSVFVYKVPRGSFDLHECLAFKKRSLCLPLGTICVLLWVPECPEPLGVGK